MSTSSPPPPTEPPPPVEPSPAARTGLGTVLVSGLRALVAPVVVARNAYVRSIQARVVISILLLSALVIALVGALLTQQIAAGLTETKRVESVNVAAGGVRSAQELLNAESDASTQSALVKPLLETLATRGGTPRTYEVEISAPAGASYFSDLTPDERAVPERLREEVAGSDELAWTYTSVEAADGEAVPAVAVGSQVRVATTGDTYELYYVFPMADEVRTLSLLRRGLASAAVALMVLIAGVAWLVTRQVVTPVRLARRIAERLAAGRLEERMHVRGADDIARLGTSFNAMADSLQRQIRQLEELSRVQQRFVSDVSHELRTPLTTVRMAADVLHDAKDGFDPVTARSAELLQNELDRFQDLLTDLLEISRFDAGAANLELETIDLTALARRVVAAHTTLATRAGVELSVRAPAEPVLVDADARRIERVVRNLVSNAIGYSGSPRVELRLAADAGAVALAVRDWGVGLRPGETTLVFNRFWRADPARARSGGGTGLGLAIALEDAQLHGGWLQAWGHPGEGAQFRLTLPARRGAELTGSPLPLVPVDAVTSAIGRAYLTIDTPRDEPAVRDS
jgi:two-component system sensor histidine kinase MtrB